MMKELLTRQKVILKFYSKNLGLNPKNSKNMLSEECQALLLFLFFLSLLISSQVTFFLKTSLNSIKSHNIKSSLIWNYFK